MSSIWQRRWIFFPVAASGILVLLLAVNRPQGSGEPEVPRPPAAVRVMVAHATTITPRVTGHGTVRPARVWQAVAEVAGRITQLHPQLRAGAFIPEGEVIATIDPADYNLSVARYQSALASAEARLAESAIKEENAKSALAIEQQALGLARKEFERKQELVERNTATRAALEQAERDLLARRQVVLGLQNQLRELPAQRKVLAAELEVNRSELERARLELERTVLRAPFGLRVAELRVELAQYVARGQALAVADSVDSAEVSAQLPPGRLAALFDPARQQQWDATTANLNEALGVSAVVRFRGGNRLVEWPGKLARIEAELDPQTRTVGLVVTVDHPYAEVRPGVRPPLTKNMFVEVEFSGPPRPGVMAIPRSALHEGELYLAENGRLRRVPVAVGFTQGEFAMVTSGLAEGAQVVLSELNPAVPGMALQPLVVSGEPE